jgi:hypothetical protein
MHVYFLTCCPLLPVVLVLVQLEEAQSQLAAAAGTAAAALASAGSMADSPLQSEQQEQQQQQRELLQQRVSELESELGAARQLWSEQSDWQEAAERAATNNTALKEQLQVLQQQLAQAEAQLADMCGRDYIAELEQKVEEECEARATAEQLLAAMQVCGRVGDVVGCCRVGGGGIASGSSRRRWKTSVRLRRWLSSCWLQCRYGGWWFCWVLEGAG